MKELDYTIITKLDFQDSVKINGKLMYRDNDSPGYDTFKKSWTYGFYDKWDKKKNLLPIVRYSVSLYAKEKKEKGRDGWITHKTVKIMKAEIEDYKRDSVEKIVSIEKVN